MSTPTGFKCLPLQNCESTIEKITEDVYKIVERVTEEGDLEGIDFAVKQEIRGVLRDNLKAIIIQVRARIKRRKPGVI